MRRWPRGVAAATGVIAAVLVATAALAPPVSAGGGSVLATDRDHYEPGEPVHLTADVRKLDLDWFGPYTVSLRPSTPEGSLAPPGEDPRDTVVGRLVVTRMDPTFVRAELTFVLPKLADGEYWVQYCNPGCTKQLGDLLGGHLRVGEVPPPPTATPTSFAVTPVDAPPPSIVTTEAAPTTAATGSADVIAAAAGEGDERAWPPPIALAGAASVVGLVLAIVVLARRRGPRHVVTSHGSVDDGDPSDDVVAVDLEPVPQHVTTADAASTIGSAR